MSSHLERDQMSQRIIQQMPSHALKQGYSSDYGGLDAKNCETRA